MGRENPKPYTFRQECILPKWSCVNRRVIGSFKGCSADAQEPEVLRGLGEVQEQVTKETRAERYRMFDEMLRR